MPSSLLPRAIADTRSKLLLASAGMLFTELVLIRWLGENILYLTYFTNFVLLASFLGIGLGFLAGTRNSRWLRGFPYAMLALIAFVLVFPIRLDREVEDVLFLGTGRIEGLPAWLLLPVVFCASALVMALVGQEVARLFAHFDPLSAYRLDILGSIIGILLFTVMSFLRAPPAVWGVTVGVLWLLAAPDAFDGPRRIALIGIGVVLTAQTLAPGLQWSPYYRISVRERNDIVGIGANGIPHQVMATLDQLRSVDWLAGWPYELLDPQVTLDDVLIIGAGSGNDVLYALDAGANRVDAVEIDPVFHELGVEEHPDHPYDDERVRVVIDDGRAFMERTTSRYDLIVFALTDSLTIVSGQSNLRLESYLFTEQAVIRARELLRDDGVVAFYNQHSEEWIIARMADTLRTAFDGPICKVGSRRPAPGFLVAAGPGLLDGCEEAEAAPTGELAPPTDDKPFLYVRSAGLPMVYAASLTGILLLAGIAVRAIAGRGLSAIAPYSDLFLMGVAFLLLETKGIVQFALWFGTTWTVNALVFVGILTSVWLAIEVAERFGASLSLRALYLALFTAMGLAWVVPPELLLSLSIVPRWLAATTLTFGPVFLANLLFAQRFRDTATATAAFGANLLGAMVGGTLEYASLVTGHRNLLVIAAAAYLGAFLFWRRTAPESVLRKALVTH